MGSGLAGNTTTLSIINPSIGITVTSSKALLTCIAFFKTKEVRSKLKTLFTKLRNWIIFITILYEKTLSQSKIHEKIDQKEADELKKLYNHYPDKRKEFINSTKFRVEDIFGDVIFKDSLSPEQITKHNKFLAKKCRNCFF